MAYYWGGNVVAINELPKDSMMLLSFVNTRLRDEKIVLEDFCAQFGVSSNEIMDKLKTIGYEYSEELNKFV